MKMFGVRILGALCTLWLLTGIAFAQSSGNFSAQIFNTICSLDTSTGALSSTCTPTVNGTQCASLSTPIKLSNGNGTTLLVTPSMVTGLYTDTKIDTSLSSTSADVGIQVCVTVTPDGSSTPISGAVQGGNANGCVVYDQRFQSISSQLFSQLSQCTAAPTNTPCSSDADCSSLGAGYTCDTTASVCVGPNPLCNFDLTLSTLSAHAYNFVVNVPGGNYDVNATWSLIGVASSNKNATVAACAGPGTLTVTQTKVFNNSGTITTN